MGLATLIGRHRYKVRHVARASQPRRVRQGTVCRDGSATVQPQAGTLAMAGERGLLHRLEPPAPGTRVQLPPGRVGTLREVTFTCAIVELDQGEDRRREIALGCEVEVLT